MTASFGLSHKQVGFKKTLIRNCESPSLRAINQSVRIEQNCNKTRRPHHEIGQICLGASSGHIIVSNDFLQTPNGSLDTRQGHVTLSDQDRAVALKSYPMRNPDVLFLRCFVQPLGPSTPITEASVLLVRFNECWHIKRVFLGWNRKIACVKRLEIYDCSISS